MKLHERVMIVQAARLEVSQATLAAIEKHNLTYGEVTAILAEVLATWAKYQIRGERHPDDPEKRGGEA